MAATLKRIFHLIRSTSSKYSADGCGRMGAALAYYSLFSLFPLLLLLISLLGFMLASGMPLLVDARTSVLDTVGRTLPQARDLLALSIEQAQAARGATGIVGLFTLLWSASNAFTQLYQALNEIWGCLPAGTVRAAIRTKLTAIAVVLVISCLLLASIITDATVSVVVRRMPLPPGWILVWQDLAPFASVALAAAVFAMLYRYLPNTKVQWRTVWPGALVAGVAWEVLRQGFTIYTTRYSNYAAVYGAVGSTMALLSWIYLSAQILLFGAEFTVVYGRLLQGERLGGAGASPAAGADEKELAIVEAVQRWAQRLWQRMTGGAGRR